MRLLLENEMRSVNAGASKYVTCYICGRKRKTRLIERLFWSNAKVQGSMASEHGLNSAYGTKLKH